MFDLEYEFSTTPTQNAHTSCAIGPIVDNSKPDITLLCEICKCFLNISELSSHTAYHAAMQLYKFKEIPMNMEILLKRRDLLIQRMQRFPIPNETFMKYVKTINDTFQILKRTIEPYYYGDNGWTIANREASTVQGLSFTPRNRVFLSVGMCASQNKQFKANMEDTMRFIDCFGGNEKFAYVGLFDGYNGKVASSLCRDHLHEAILFEMAKIISNMKSSEIDDTLINRLYARLIANSDNCRVQNVGDVFRLAYSKMDYLLSRGMHETSPIRWSGTSTLTAVIVTNDKIDNLLADLDEMDEDSTSITLGHIHVANCGNVEALGIRGSEAFLMTQKHTLISKREHERIAQTGIYISENNLVAGILETTRGLGNHGDKDLKMSVNSVPYVWTYEIDATLECIILATEGLWKVLPYDVVIDIVTQCLPAHHLPAPSRARTALRSVLERYAKSPAVLHSPNNDEILACMTDLLDILEEEPEQDDGGGGENKIFMPPIVRNRGVQCSAADIQQEIWNSLSAQQRLRLELAQTIAERLVSAALLAGSKSNISVFCLLLPGAAV